MTVFFSTIITVLLFYFMIRYRRRSPGQIGQDFAGNTMLLETAWIIVPLVIALTFFAWGAKHLLRRGEAAGRRSPILRRRQAVDVEDRASRAASGRSTSCTSRAGKR